MLLLSSIPNRRPDEEVIFHLRRHWFVFFKIFLFFAALAFIPWAVYYLLTLTTPEILTGIVGNALTRVLFLSYYLVMLVFALTAWTDTYLDVWTVTNYRIICREQNGLFNRVVSQLYLEEIQDITAEQKGFWATIFHYGEVFIQTAAEKERFVFEQIPQPYRIAKIIQQLNDQAEKRAQKESFNANGNRENNQPRAI